MDRTACSRITLVALGAALLASCATGPSPQTEREAHRYRPPATAAVPVSAATYLARAASGDLYAMRASELALGRAVSPRLRNFAAQNISAERGMAAQLSFAGRRLDLLPSTTLYPRHQAMLDQLSAASDFDSTYKRQQVSVLQDALALHGRYALRGGSATLRPVAAAAVPIVRRQIDLLRGL